jgi:hypothetical protein
MNLHIPLKKYDFCWQIQRFANSILKNQRYSWSGWFLVIVFICTIPLMAQPSGGPYGLLQQRYELPKETAHIYFVVPDGKADAPGTLLIQPTSLEAAIDRVVTGDAIILRGGIYRTGGLLLNQGIIMQPYAD